jgi:hypothetical protein
MLRKGQGDIGGGIGRIMDDDADDEMVGQRNGRMEKDVQESSHSHRSRFDTCPIPMLFLSQPDTNRPHLSCLSLMAHCLPVIVSAR